MKVLHPRKMIFDVLSLMGLAAVTAGLLAFPAQMTAAAGEGVEMCFNVLIPSLFPFFVVSSLTVELGLADRMGAALSPVMGPLFNVGGQCAGALILGFIGGYPVGARTVISLYESGRCTKDEAERMLAFCNNSGPAFIFGVVGAGIFSSSAVGLILYLTHILASVLVGLIFRNHGSYTAASEPVAPARSAPFPAAFVKSVTSSFSSCLNICGFVIFFTVLIRLMVLSGVITTLANALGLALGAFGMDSAWAERMLTGLIELTSGVWSLRAVTSGLRGRVAMAAFMLGWAGLSVHCQVLSFLYESGLSARTYIAGKLLHGLLSAGLAAAAVSLLSVDVPVGAYLADQVVRIADLGFRRTLTVSLALAGAIMAIFVLASLFFTKRSGKKGGNTL